jgi:hypothetical protein
MSLWSQTTWELADLPKGIRDRVRRCLRDMAPPLVVCVIDPGGSVVVMRATLDQKVEILVERPKLPRGTTFPSTILVLDQKNRLSKFVVQTAKR